MQLTGRFSLSVILKTILGGAWYLALIAMVVSLVGAGYLLFSGNLTEEGVKVGVPIEMIDGARRSIPLENSDTMVHISKLNGYLQVPSPGFLLSAAFILRKLGSIAVFLVVVFLLRSVFRTVSAGEPFTPPNAGRIRMIGLVLLATYIIDPCIQFGVSSHVVRTYAVTGLAFRTEFPLNVSLIFIGLAVIVLGEIFRMGAELREDQALTI